jgi:protein-S-isoprenylcysteine O-methyltransferase Ste14
MSRRRIRNRQRVLPTLPYWRSILASFVLVLSMMFVFEALADPRSGELRPPKVVAPVFVLFVLLDAGVFYAEFRLRKRRLADTVRTQRRVAMKGEGACVD